MAATTPATQTSDAQEARRLAALRAYKILDTPPEETFDNIARLAAHIFGASKAAVTLIDADRQWFKARVNLDVDQTELSRSFCVNAVRDKATLVAPDASVHPALAHYANVVGEDQYRFYVGAPLIDSDGVALGTVCAFDTRTHDVTPEQVAALEALAREATARLELRKAAQALAESARSRKELLDVLAHEVNGAIAPVVGCADLLASEGTNLPPEAAELLDIVRRNTARAGHLDRDIVELARIEGDRLKVERRELDVDVLLAHAAMAMRTLASTHGITLRVAPSAPGLPLVSADERRMQQVLTNLIGNSIKFTPRGGTITLAASYASGEIVISVADTGAGMTREQASSLFQRFSQLGHVARDGDPGNGLGLFICRQLVEAHGGRIWSESEGAGRGSVFRVALAAA